MMTRIILLALLMTGASACSSVKNVESKTEDQDILTDVSTIFFEMQKRGVDFYAQGSNDTWMLEVDFQKKVKFVAKNLHKDFEVNVLSLGNGLKGSEARHVVKNKEGELTIDIKTGEKPFEQEGSQAFEVSVAYIDLSTGVEKKYKGKGTFYGAIQLHDIWNLEEINGEKIDTTNLHKHPYIEFYLDKGKVMGFLGCNSFSTGIYFGRNQVSFNQIMRTKMACNNSDVEQRFSKIIAGKTLNYRLEGLNLILENDTEKLVFKKGD